MVLTRMQGCVCVITTCVRVLVSVFFVKKKNAVNYWDDQQKGVKDSSPFSTSWPTLFLSQVAPPPLNNDRYS